MGLLSTEVEIIIDRKVMNHYIELGYDVPMFYNKSRHKYTLKRAKTKVKVEDLTKGSQAIVVCECDECHKKMEMKWVIYFKHNHDGKIYCHKCAIKLLNSGENHHLWNPDKTIEERIQNRKYPEYIEFVKACLARDNYTCQCCGKKGQDDLEVHHLEGYEWCKEKRVDETNGITLCKNCHYNFHSIYGRGGNTKNQFEEWIGITQLELKKYNGSLPIARWAYCVTDNEIIKNIAVFSKQYGLDHRSIYACCNGRRCTYQNKIYMWYDEYMSLSKEELDIQTKQKILVSQKHQSRKMVINTTYNLVFTSSKYAGMYFNLTPQNIRKHCRESDKNINKTLNSYPIIWKYVSDKDNLEDYTLISNEECEKRRIEQINQQNSFCCNF